jgi:glycosyltransferase involved in cell wall biosynthesis
LDLTRSLFSARRTFDIDLSADGVEEPRFEFAEESRFRLSVLMPVHNEKATIEAAVADVLEMKLGYPFELIIVDDGSTDGTSSILACIDDPRVLVYRHPTNLGKGAAVLSAAALAGGTHLVIFDADREYRAADLVRLFQPVVDETAEVVFGVRILGMNTAYQSYRYALGNRLTTLAANVLFDACLSDLHCCLKMFPVDLFRSLSLTHSGFGLDSEITAELLRRGYRPYEIPVSYNGRSHAAGKKLTWRDGVDCLATLSRVRRRGTITLGVEKASFGQVALHGVGGEPNDLVGDTKQGATASRQLGPN